METTYVLTAEMDALSFAWLDALRREYFPEERNFLSAHLTLFHKLSSAQIACVRFAVIFAGKRSQHVGNLAR